MYRFFNRRPVVGLKSIRSVLTRYDNSKYYKYDVNDNDEPKELDHVVPVSILKKYGAPLTDGHNLMYTSAVANRNKRNNTVGNFIPTELGKGPLARAVLHTYWAWLNNCIPPNRDVLEIWNLLYPPTREEIERETEIFSKQRLPNLFIREYKEISILGNREDPNSIGKTGSSFRVS